MSVVNPSKPKSAAPRRGPVPSKTAKGVFVPMDPDLLADLDADRAQLGVSRGRAIRDGWLEHRAAGGVAQSAAAQQRQAASAADLQAALRPLVDAVNALTEAINARAYARNSIGVHTNQMAKCANAYGNVPAGALAWVERRLGELEVGDRDLTPLAADVRAVLDALKV